MRGSHWNLAIYSLWQVHLIRKVVDYSVTSIIVSQSRILHTTRASRTMPLRGCSNNVSYEPLTTEIVLVCVETPTV